MWSVVCSIFYQLGEYFYLITCLNVHTIMVQEHRSSLPVLIDSLQSHLSNDVLLSWNFGYFKKYEQIQKLHKNIQNSGLVYITNAEKSVAFSAYPHAAYFEYVNKQGLCVNIDRPGLFSFYFLTRSTLWISQHFWKEAYQCECMIVVYLSAKKERHDLVWFLEVCLHQTHTQT